MLHFASLLLLFIAGRKELMRALCVMFVCAVFASFSGAEAQPALNLMPMPAHVQTGSGQLVVNPSFSVAISGSKDARLEAAAHRFLDHLRQQTGMVALDMSLTGGATASLAIHADHASKDYPELGEDESYTLEVASTGAQLNAPTTLGVLRGLQTFLQLVRQTPAGFAVPAVSIQDQPRFPWRGLMIDVSRHFMPLEVLRRNLDGMEAVKLNVLHLHLSDNQGFRIESKKFPKLQELGSGGLYYTQEEMRGLIEYAADRGIRILPEFDIPGHSTSWFVGYPELASGPGPYTVDPQGGVLDPVMDPTQNHTYKFLNEFIGEMAKLFPDAYFHIGGDEVNGKQWDANPKIQQFMHEHKIANNEALQAYFNQRVQEIVHKHHKIMLGWDEILQPDLPKDIVIQSWRGQASLAEAAKQGYSGLLSSGYYLDLNQPAAEHYAVDPMTGPTADLTPEQKKLILGGEACMWSEYVSPENVDSRIWPRTAAIAERLWSPQNVTDVSSMYARLQNISSGLDWLGLTHNSSYGPMLRRIAGSNDIASLRTLGDVVEPVKGYTRYELALTPPTMATPLNRLVDAARPESMTARRFAEQVDAFVAGNIKPGLEDQIKALLTRWRDNQVELRPLEEQSALLQEATPISQNLSALGAAGLQALGYLDRGEPAPADWVSAQQAQIAQMEKPGSTQVLLMVAPSVEKLITASAGQAEGAAAK
jgi:hexosaminidase